MRRDSIEVFRALNEESAKYRTVIFVSPVLTLFALGLSLASVWGLVAVFFYLGIFIQSIRRVRRLKRLKIKLLETPSQVNESDVINGTIIIAVPGLHWFVSLTR